MDVRGLQRDGCIRYQLVSYEISAVSWGASELSDISYSKKKRLAAGDAEQRKAGGLQTSPPDGSKQWISSGYSISNRA
jgi:hypothetical protein